MDPSKKDPRGILEDRADAKQYIASIEEKELAASLKKRWNAAYKHRLSWERQWEINWLYKKGEQPVRNLTTGDVFRLPQDDNSRLISGNNIITPTHRSLVGKLTRNIPTCTVVPPTSDISDINGAHVADSLLYFVRRKEKIDKKYIRVYKRASIFGMGYWKLSWDRTAGRDVGVCASCGYRAEEEWTDEMEGQPCPQCDAEIGEPYRQQVAQDEAARGMEAQALGVDPASLDVPQAPPPEIPSLAPEREGDIRVDALDPREIWVDPAAAELEDAQWFCHRVALPVSEVRRRFPDWAPYLDKEAGIHAEQYITLVRGSTTFRAGTRQLEDHVYLYEFHEKPTEEYPDGRIIWMCNDLVLEQIASPYYKKLGRFPLYVFYWEHEEGEFYGSSWIEQAAPIQREYNILLTQMREQREMTNNPQAFVPSNAGLAIDEFDTTAGRIYFYNAMGGGKPDWRPIPPFAEYNYQEIARMEGAVRTQAAVTEQEAGITEAEASGRLAAIIESEASQQVGPTLKENSSEFIELHRGILIITNANYTTDRKWTTTGSDQPRPMTYYYEDMNLEPGWDIDIQEEDSLSKNTAVRLTQTSELANGPVTSQLFLDPKTGMFDQKKFIAKSGLKMPGMMNDARSGQHAYAAALPKMIERGEEYVMRSFDDPEIFTEELGNWLNSVGRSGKVSEQVVAKVEEYYTFYLQRTQAALMQMSGGVGAAPAPGAPSGAPAAGGAGAGGPGAPPQGGPPSSADTSANPEADKMVKESDQAGEKASRTSANHEG